MIRVSRPLRLIVAGVALAVLGAACGTPTKDKSSEGKVDTTTTTVAKGPDSTAAQLRSKLNGLLQEHVYLTAAVAGAVADGRGDEATAASAALAANSDALIANFAAIFDATTGKKFGELWEKQAGYLAAYAQGNAAAGSDLAQNAREIGAFLNSKLADLSADAATNLVNQYEVTLKAAIDAGRAGDWAKAYTDLRATAAHMNTVSSDLVEAMAKNDPFKIGGDPASKAADLVTTLHVGLREHLYLAAAATNGALGGRTDEFTGASAALNGNSDDLASAIGSVYGADAGKAFGPLWKKHIALLVDYTTAVAGKDQAKADEAMGNLLSYAEDFGAFISTASPKLTKDAVAELVRTHLLTLKDVIDAQAAKNFAKAYPAERTAADHMAMIAKGLATTIVAQFPTKF